MRKTKKQMYFVTILLLLISLRFSHFWNLTCIRRVKVLKSQCLLYTVSPIASSSSPVSSSLSGGGDGLRFICGEAWGEDKISLGLHSNPEFGLMIFQFITDVSNVLRLAGELNYTHLNQMVFPVFPNHIHTHESSSKVFLHFKSNK